MSGKPKPITTGLLRKINTLVIVADNVPSEIFQSKKYGLQEYRWEIKDVVRGDEEEVREIISRIEKKVKEFVKELK